MELLLSILTSAFWVILAIMILVFIHELGHFLTAKMFGMRVERFSVGFPPKLFGRTVGRTEYMLGATPLGGYVKISGMIDESMDTDYQQSEPKPWEFRSKPVWQRIVVITAGVTFNIILAAIIFMGLKMAYGETYIPAENVEGVYVPKETVAYEMGLRTGDHIVAVNGAPLERIGTLNEPSTLLADTLRITVERGGERVTLEGPQNIMTKMNRAGGLGIGAINYLPPLVDGVSEDFPAAEAGLRAGDRIVSIEEDTVRFWIEMSTSIQESGGQPLTVRWLRPDSLVQPSDTAAAPGAADASSNAADTPRYVAATPRGALFEAEIAPRQDESNERYLLGVQRPTQQSFDRIFGTRQQRYGAGEALLAGVGETWTMTENIVVSLQRIFVGRENLRENLGGPIMVAQVTQQAAQAGPRYFWRIVAVLSITLAIMNILPIPALDGGHLVFLLYEGITRREPSVRVRMAAQQIGLILLIGFMVFMVFNDILRL